MRFQHVSTPTLSAPANKSPRYNIAVGKLPEWIAHTYGVDRPHIATVFRWLQRGARGVAPPASFLIGGRRYVNTEEFRTFIDDLNGIDRTARPAKRERVG